MAKDETTGMRKAVKIAFNKPAPAQQGNSQKLSGSIRDLKKAIIKVDSNPKPLNESQRLENNFNSWAKSQPSAQKNTVKETIKINSNPVKTSGLQGREVGKMDHQGGHGLQGGAISAFGGGGLPEQTR